ncbi:hypothetical protein FSP39_001874 [Pinctada imbricata]|uniref:Amine oxidase n=1 Tax=Pinctada imbricata TaxID=66713 RepID=A0AA89BZN8_PINIB|nr:hypothetical protein FSP39_001874 [Pinctada imbricata]
MNTGLKQPLVEEYVIGPLGNYKEMSMRKLTESPTSSVPYRVRQFTFPEVLEMYITIKRYTEIHDILLESYGATLFDCIDNNLERCLVAYKSHVPIVYSSERKIWISFFYYMEYYTLHPIDFEILMNIQSSKSDDWTIESIWYAGRFYPDYKNFVDAYKNNTIPKMKLKFPVDDIKDTQIPGSLHRRSTSNEDAVNEDTKRGPIQFEPDGRRFEVIGQSVRYMGWEFDWKNSLVGGPQLHNVKFNRESIAYEIGIQDIVVMYSGKSPAFSHAAFADGLNGLGSKTAGLVPGVDCPDYALMLNISVVTEDFLTDSTLSNTLCIFEHNNGVPLRRHYANSHGQAGVFYGGLESKVLIFRTIFVVNNYDYIMDYMFYENGVFETKVYPTGYVLTTYSFDDKSDFGFNMDKRIIAPYHLHLFHFKVDLDILGLENRYKTVDIKVEKFTSNVSIYSNGTQYRYKLKQSIKKTEKEATEKTNESTAKYHLFYNEKYKNSHNEYRSYQLKTKDCVEQLLPENYGFESSIKWSRYKLAVTKRKTGEERSSSMYASFDAGKPTVDFQKFIDDNDDIVDEDLVAWVTLGMHHIPHTEDIPNVATAGKSLSFSLLPFNFFEEDPSIASRNFVRITPKDPTDSRKGLHIERYGTKETYSCIPPSYDYNILRKDGSSIFYPVN